MTRVGGFAELDCPRRAENVGCAPSNLASLHCRVVSIDRAAAVDRSAAVPLHALLPARGYLARR